MSTSRDNEESVLPIPNLKLQQYVFTLLNGRASQEILKETKASLLTGIEADEMAPYYESLTSDPTTSHLLTLDSTLLSKLQALNATVLTKIDEQLEDAEKNLGNTEISDALRAKANYLAKIGEKDAALKAHEAVLLKVAGLGSRIDIRLAMIRIGLFHAEHEVVSTNIDKAQLLVDEGGDWDRRNRLKAYKGIHLLSIRNFLVGGQLLLDTLSTFTATELIDYDDFVTLCVIAGAMTLERKDLKKKIIESPEVIAVIPTVPSLHNFCDSLYKCDYSTFFKCLAKIEETHFLDSRLLSVHARFYVREMRIRAYAQLLESYRSVTIKSLAEAFGVGEDFIDADLSRFISAGRLNCSIDRVNGIVETNRPDAKNARYEAVVKQGDVLLTSVQRLSRVIG